jgi:hypothetical protein
MPINIGEASRKAESDEFWAARGKAIDAFAMVEAGLCRLFSVFAGVDEYTARVIFYKIRNMRNLDIIMQTLLHIKFPNEYDDFWKTLRKRVHTLGDQRNDIVHWHVTIGIDGSGFSGIGLMPTDKLVYLNEQIVSRDLKGFRAECIFMANLCNQFWAFLVKEKHPGIMSAEKVQTWHGIFHKAIEYPPPNTHPLYPILEELENRQPPSPASPQSSPTEPT